MAPTQSPRDSWDLEGALFSGRCRAWAHAPVCQKEKNKDGVVRALAVPALKAFIRTELGTFVLARGLAFPGKEPCGLDLVVFALV